MRAVRIHGPADARLDELQVPRVSPEDVLVRMRACGVCGTDLHYIRAGSASLRPDATGPSALGHEFAGEVISVGARVEGLAPGDRVFVNPIDAVAGEAIGNGAREGAFADYVLVRNASRDRLLALPLQLPFEIAALAEPMSVALHAVRRSAAAPGDRVAVLGAGPIGLGVAIWLKHIGVDETTAFDLSAERAARAARFGVKAARFEAARFAETLSAHHGPSARPPMPATDIFIDATGAPAALAAIVRTAKPRARITVVGLFDETVPVDVNAVVTKELLLNGAVGYGEETREAIAFLAANVERMGDYITHRYRLDQAMDAFRMAAEPVSGKVMVLGEGA